MTTELPLSLAPSRRRITTATGSVYLLHQDPSTGTTLTRHPNAAPLHPMADGHTVPGTLRRDEEAIKVLQIVQLEIGLPARFLLDVVRRDGIETFRITSPIISMVEVDPTD